MVTKSKFLLIGLFIVGTLAPAGMSYADTRDVVHDETNGTVLRSTSGACVRTRWTNGYDECNPQAVAVPARVEISREERTVYFAFNQAALSPEMKRHLDTLATKIKSQQDVKEARVVGYADRIGDKGYNEKLSKRRAESVRKYLVSRGIVNSRVVDTRWLGSTTSTTSCPANLKRPQLIDCLQKDRRVEVEIDYFSDAQGNQ
jgi:outer membrane protein OmpA-like peptidoglycan-associated protein